MIFSFQGVPQAPLQLLLAPEEEGTADEREKDQDLPEAIVGASDELARSTAGEAWGKSIIFQELHILIYLKLAT